MPEETQLLAAEGALGDFDIEPFLLQDRQDLPDVTDVLLQRGAIEEKVVHVYDHGAVQGPTSPLYAQDPWLEPDATADPGTEVPATAASGT
jgi:hypothetical protein